VIWPVIGRVETAPIYLPTYLGKFRKFTLECALSKNCHLAESIYQDSNCRKPVRTSQLSFIIRAIDPQPLGRSQKIEFEVGDVSEIHHAQSSLTEDNLRQGRLEEWHSVAGSRNRRFSVLSVGDKIDSQILLTNADMVVSIPKKAPITFSWGEETDLPVRVAVIFHRIDKE
jgi:hypothetical protein